MLVQAGAGPPTSTSTSTERRPPRASRRPWARNSSTISVTGGRKSWAASTIVPPPTEDQRVDSLGGQAECDGVATYSGRFAAGDADGISGRPERWDMGAECRVQVRRPAIPSHRSRRSLTGCGSRRPRPSSRPPPAGPVAGRTDEDLGGRSPARSRAAAAGIGHLLALRCGQRAPSLRDRPLDELSDRLAVVSRVKLRHCLFLGRCIARLPPQIAPAPRSSSISSGA